MPVLQAGRRLPLDAGDVREGDRARPGGGLGLLGLPVPLQPHPLPVEARRAVPGRGGHRQGRARQQIPVDRVRRHPVQQQGVAHLVGDVLGDAVPVGLHHELVRVVRLGEPAPGGMQQRVGAVAQPQPEPPRLPALFEGDTRQSAERYDEFAQLAAEQAHVLVPARGQAQGVPVEGPSTVLLDDFRHAGIVPPDLRDSGLDQV